MNVGIEYLSTLRNDLKDISYDKIYEIISEIKYKAVPTALLHSGRYINRVRINEEPNEIYSNIKKISYNSQAESVNKIDFGRANIPKQSIFYGSVDLNNSLMTAYFETSQLQKNIDQYDNVEEVFTLGRWRVLSEIKILEKIFCKEALAVNEQVQQSFNAQLKKIKSKPLLFEYYKRQLEFFSDEFARNDIGRDESFKYKISSAYVNYMWNCEKFKLLGVTYPSVMTDYIGQNVALKPEVVDEYLILEEVYMFKFERINKENLPIKCIKLATELGKNQMEFKWKNFIYDDVRK